MSVTDELKPAGADGALSRRQWTRAGVAQWLSVYRRPSRAQANPARYASVRLAIGGVAAVIVIAGTMIFVDAWAMKETRHLPRWLVDVFNELTEFGKSGWFLVPIGALLTATALLASSALPRISRLVFAAIAIRLAFLFAAIALPGLAVSIVKRLIGRARPLIDGGLDPFAYRPLGWSVEYASMPSGHATNACAAAFAIGALWPRVRPIMWAYAVAIGISRVVVAAHHPSDVLAGALVGILGAFLVRDWFAARGLGFVRAADGGTHVLPGPSFRRIKGVARQAIGS